MEATNNYLSYLSHPAEPDMSGGRHLALEIKLIMMSRRSLKRDVFGPVETEHPTRLKPIFHSF